MLHMRCARNASLRVASGNTEKSRKEFTRINEREASLPFVVKDANMIIQACAPPFLYRNK